jgi:hypothetical protein
MARVFADTKRITPPPDDMELVPLCGQSNMTGLGVLDDGESLIARYQNQAYLYTLGGKWYKPAFEPTHSTEQPYGGSQYPDVWPPQRRAKRGLALHFANKWAQLNMGAQRVGLIPCAKAGTSLAEHLPSNLTTTLYGASKARINKAKDRGSVLCILWSIGEEDAKTQANAEAHSSRFQTINAKMREDHGADIPVIFTQLGDNPNLDRFPYWNTVRSQQAAAENAIENCKMIVTDGLLKLDGVHYLNESYQYIGEKMASELSAMV